MGRLKIGLILVLAGSLATLGYMRYQEHRNNELGREYALRTMQTARESIARANAVSAKQFVDLATERAVPLTYPRPASQWAATERRFYEKILAAGQYDTLVVPLQVNGEAAFDRATRSLMTAELTAAIAAAQTGKVADAFLMEKVLGEGQRHYSEEELYRVANLAGARRLVWGAVGHDRKGQMSITILSQLRPKDAGQGATWATPAAPHQIPPIGLDDAHPAFESFAAHIPDVLKAISIDQQPGPAPSAVVMPAMNSLPASPLGLMTEDATPASDAYAFLLFGLLTPANLERTKERFVEKALLAASRLAPDAPEYRALHARAYAMMGYRAAAIQILGNPADGEEEEIQAMLAGNLPEVRRRIGQEHHPVKRLIAALDANRIASDYKVLSRDEALNGVKELHLPGDVWPYLVARAFTDRDPWSEFDNGRLKQLLDKELPVRGYSLEELLHGAVSVGGLDKAQSLVDLSVFNHEQRYLNEHAAHCCDPPLTRIRPIDYMELLAAMGHDNLIRRINLLGNIQGLHRDAIAYADSVRSIYAGHPYYEVVRGEAEVHASDSADGAEREGLLKSAYESVFNAMYWEQTQSAISSRALMDLGAYFRLHEYGYFDNFYYTDLPFHPNYMLWANGGNHATMQENGLAALSNATSEFAAAISLIGPDRANFTDKTLVASVVQQIQGRFIGCPERGTLLADQEILLGNVPAAEELLRENIRTSPTFRNSYISLGELQLASGKPAQAAKTFLSYPGLHSGAGTDGVTIANTAADMAGPFYFAGDLAEATKFLTISASQNSGAGSEMQSTMRLQLLGGNISGAMRSALQRAQRYSDPRAFRDYLGMLHAMQHSADAWAGFNNLVRELPEPQIWDTALVGHHMAGKSEGEIRQWVAQPEFRNAGNHMSYATTYLTRFGTMDRIPSADLADAIADFDRPTWQFDNGAHSVVRPDADGRDQQILGPAGAMTPEGVLPMGVFEHGGPKHRVRSGQAYFVAAYRAIKLGDFAQARRIFGEAGTLYDMASPASSYMLPYYALASARAGADPGEIQTILDRFSPGDQRLDYHLARAVLQAGAGKIGGSLESLAVARYRRPLDDERVVLAPYAYGDICEALYRMTANADIRKVAVDWAKSREKVEPWYSWSYALEAALTTDPTDRHKALAMTFYLDPQSVHLAAFKRAEIDAAVRAFSSLNLFRPLAPGGKPATAT